MDQDDVTINCTPITANPDTKTSTEILSGTSLTGTTLNVFTNDTLSGVTVNSGTVTVALTGIINGYT
jgi:hypothetical protein